MERCGCCLLLCLGENLAHDRQLRSACPHPLWPSSSSLPPRPSAVFFGWVAGGMYVVQTDEQAWLHPLGTAIGLGGRLHHGQPVAHGDAQCNVQATAQVGHFQGHHAWGVRGRCRHRLLHTALIAITHMTWMIQVAESPSSSPASPRDSSSGLAAASRMGRWSSGETMGKHTRWTPASPGRLVLIVVSAVGGQFGWIAGSMYADKAAEAWLRTLGLALGFAAGFRHVLASGSSQ